MKWAWHVHDSVLLEPTRSRPVPLGYKRGWLESIDERRESIRSQMPLRERDPRLHLLQPVRGAVPVELVSTWRDYDAIKRANAVRTVEWWVLGGREHSKRALAAAWRRYLAATYAPDVTALHAAECPGCPWDGQSI